MGRAPESRQIATVAALAWTLGTVACARSATRPDAAATDGEPPPLTCEACPDARPACDGSECLPCEDPRARCGDRERFRQLLARYCDSLLRVGAEAGYAAVCTLGTEPNPRRIRAAIEAGRLGIDPEALAACMASEHQPFVLPDDGVGPLGPNLCERVWVGRSPLGAGCANGAECVAGTFCEREDYQRSRPHYVVGACGACAPLRELGEPCPSGWIGTRVCRGPLSCGPEGLCVEPPPRSGLGGTCAAHEQCIEGVCRLDGSGAPGTCVLPGPLSTPCSSSLECSAGRCIDGVCGLGHARGEPCTYVGQCQAGLACDGGVCVDAQDGSACSPDVAGVCGAELVCIPSVLSACYATCRPRAPLGAECCASEQCGGGALCERGRCRAPRLVGEPCVASDDAGSFCVPGAECRAGVCELASDLGGPCTRWCARGTCVEGACSALRSGDPCRFDGLDACGPGLTCGASDVCEVVDARVPCDLGCDSETYCASTGRCTAICYLDARADVGS